MRQRQSGFTMIELIMVIVILGILAAIAMPRFIDLSSDAKEQAYQGVRGAAASAMAINYASCAAVSNDATNSKCTLVNDCVHVDNLLQGGLPTNYSVTAASAVGNGTEVSCTLTGPDSYTSPTGSTTFTGIGAGQ
jgi:MSHA pilin protein MshA